MEALFLASFKKCGDEFVLVYRISSTGGDTTS
jgi:hypothetical protein